MVFAVDKPTRTSTRIHGLTGSNGRGHRHCRQPYTLLWKRTWTPGTGIYTCNTVDPCIFSICRAVPADEDSTLPEPVDARGAIATGLKLTEEGAWSQGLVYFERALELPGTGLKRFRDKPNLISNGEKMAALYNIACCQSRLAAEAPTKEEQADHIQNGLVALAGALEAGYDDFEQIRRDEDFETLKSSDKFEGLVGRFQRKKGWW